MVKRSPFFRQVREALAVIQEPECGKWCAISPQGNYHSLDCRKRTQKRLAQRVAAAIMATGDDRFEDDNWDSETPVTHDPRRIAAGLEALRNGR